MAVTSPATMAGAMEAMTAAIKVVNIADLQAAAAD
jgi:hypothetical protein